MTLSLDERFRRLEHVVAANRESPSFPSWDRVVYWQETPLDLPG